MPDHVSREAWDAAVTELDELDEAYGIPPVPVALPKHLTGPAHRAPAQCPTVADVIWCAIVVVLMGLVAWWAMGAYGRAVDDLLWEPDPAPRSGTIYEGLCASAPTFELGNGRTVAAGPAHCTVPGGYFTLPVYR